MAKNQAYTQPLFQTLHELGFKTLEEPQFG